MVPFLGFNLAKTTSLNPHKEEAKHNRSPTWRKLLWWKLNMMKTQHRESDKKPSILETGTAKTNSAKSPCDSISDSRKPLARVGSPHPYGWKDIWLIKS